MFRIRNVVLVLASTLATAAGAESNTLTGRPGFFTPTPDGNSSISRTLPESPRVVPDVAPAKVIPDVAAAKVIPDVAVATTVRDPILVIPDAAAATTVRDPILVIPDVATATTVRDPIVRVETPAATVSKVEPELDRADREHRDMTERSVRAATSIQGAFTGATSERDR